MRQNEEKIFILLNNQFAVITLQTGKSVSSIWLSKLFHNLAKSVKAEFRCVPGHSILRANEEADLEAQTAREMSLRRDTEPNLITLAYLRCPMEHLRQDLVEKWWFDNFPAQYQDLDLEMQRRKPPELALPRQLLQNLLATRTGYGDFAAYNRLHRSCTQSGHYSWCLEP